ncbi:MAG: hypothetical protein ACLGP3_04405 [Acidobacteriota bacterium]
MRCARGGLETEFLLRFQQFTSPVMAKGVEDTALYCFNRLIGLNEVGFAPDLDGMSLEEFHERLRRRQAEHPFTMNTLSTHDIKRCEDVRARLAVLTEIPGRWKSALLRWSRMNEPFKTAKYPDRNTEYFLYQTLIGAWPIDVRRLLPYMEKAAREARQHTSWTQQNREFEDALRKFIERVLESQAFIADLESFVGQVLRPRRINSLTQTLIRYTAPGVPDTYQGSELWDLRLVDPDNRGPVDYAVRSAMLEQLERGIDVAEIVRRMDGGMPKLWVAYQALLLRRAHPEWFGAEAEYTPVYAEGSKQEHAIAYLRAGRVATVAPRWNVKLGAGWSATSLSLAPGRWKNELTGEAIPGGAIRLQQLLTHFPVALLTREA